MYLSLSIELSSRGQLVDEFKVLCKIRDLTKRKTQNDILHPSIKSENFVHFTCIKKMYNGEREREMF